jgi:hypothetical protein
MNFEKIQNLTEQKQIPPLPAAESVATEYLVETHKDPEVEQEREDCSTKKFVVSPFVKNDTEET